MREIWEETGDRLGIQQTSLEALKQAKEAREMTHLVEYKSTFEWSLHHNISQIKENGWVYFIRKKNRCSAPRVAIIREEGSNGDREMAAAFTLAGFQVFFKIYKHKKYPIQAVDVTMTDMLDGHSLSGFSGVAFVGGFSYADVLGSAKGIVL